MIEFYFSKLPKININSSSIVNIIITFYVLFFNYSNLLLILYV